MTEKQKYLLSRIESELGVKFEGGNVYEFIGKHMNNLRTTPVPTVSSEPDIYQHVWDRLESERMDSRSREFDECSRYESGIYCKDDM